jgi:TonB family protein
MKHFFALFTLLLISCLCYAVTADTAKKVISTEPEYPGGLQAFDRYIRRNLHYPWPARLMCINGSVYVSFVIGSDGKVTKVTAINCLGAGCESEAVRVVQKSRPWKPGLQNGQPASVNFTIPINFNIEHEKVYMENLMASGYGFVFKIKGVLYTADEAEEILGKTFKPEKIESAEPFYNYDNNPRFVMRHKREAFLVIIK